jgi:hypothetical protein
MGCVRVQGRPLWEARGKATAVKGVRGKTAASRRLVARQGTRALGRGAPGKGISGGGAPGQGRGASCLALTLGEAALPRLGSAQEGERNNAMARAPAAAGRAVRPAPPRGPAPARSQAAAGRGDRRARGQLDGDEHAVDDVEHAVVAGLDVGVDDGRRGAGRLDLDVVPGGGVGAGVGGGGVRWGAEPRLLPRGVATLRLAAAAATAALCPARRGRRCAQPGRRRRLTPTSAQSARRSCRRGATG